MHGALQSVNIHYTESRSLFILEGRFGYVNEELKKSFQTKDNPEPFLHISKTTQLHSMSPNSFDSDKVYVTQRGLKCTCTLAVQIE